MDMAQPAAWAQSVLGRLAELGTASANASNSMTMAVTLDACALESDSLARFAAYSSVIWGAQALWWEGVSACAPLGSDDFALIGSINRRVAQWAEPLFLKSKNEAVYLYAQPGVYNVVRYAVAQVWSTSSLKLPPVQGVTAARPSPGGLIENMDDDVIAIHLVNTSVVPSDKTRALLFLSTAFAPSRGGAPIRQLSIQMRSDITSAQPVEPDLFQGWGDLPHVNSPPGIAPNFFGTKPCFLSWWGGKLPLQLAGGAAQFVTYTKLETTSTTRLRAQVPSAEAELRRKLGRTPLRSAGATH